MKRKPRTYICNPLLPTREIHLIAGGSGAGKSTFACQIMCDLLAGGEFFGLPIDGPKKVAYLAFDRSEDGMYDTFKRTVGSDEIPFPFYSTTTSPEFQKPEYQDVSLAMKRIQELHSDLDVLVLDGIGMAFTGDSSSLTDVARFVKGLVRTLHSLPHPMAVFALHHMGKVKKGNEYAAARSRIHGSVAWAATSETVILIEAEDEDDASNPHRRVTVCPRNAPERIYTYEFDEDGRLVPSASIIPGKSKLELLVEALYALPEGNIITAQIEQIADSLAISRATTTRYIGDLCEQKTLHKIKRGIYQCNGVRLKKIST